MPFTSCCTPSRALTKSPAFREQQRTVWLCLLNSHCLAGFITAGYVIILESRPSRVGVVSCDRRISRNVLKQVVVLLEGWEGGELLLLLFFFFFFGGGVRGCGGMGLLFFWGVEGG